MTEDGLFVCQDPTVNIWTDDWDDDEDWSGGGAKSRRLVGSGLFLGATVYARHDSASVKRSRCVGS